MSSKHAASRIRVWPAVSSALAPYSKALTPIGGALVLLSLACAPFSPGGAWWVVTGEEWAAVAAAAGLTYPVYRVPNKDPKAEHQDESTQPPTKSRKSPKDKPGDAGKRAVRRAKSQGVL